MVISVVSSDGSFTLTVVIVDSNEVAEFQVSSERRGFGRNTLLETAITEEDVGVVVHEVKAVFVEGRAHVSLTNGKTDGVGDTLTEGTGGDLNALCDANLGVTWSN